MTNNRFLLVLLLVTTFIIPAAAADTAASIMSRLSALVSKSPSITATFTIKMPDAADTKGSITIAKKAFTMTAGDMSVWYDGKIQWVLSKSANEVSITEPDAAELAETNPFAIFASYREHFSAKIERTDKTSKTVLLTAKSKNSAIKSARITVSNTTGYPTELSLTLASGAVTKIRVTSFTKGASLPATYFKFNTKANPKVSVNDLR